MAEKKVIHIANKNSGGLYGTSDTLCSFSSAFLYLPQYMLTTYFFFHQIPVFFSNQDVQRHYLTENYRSVALYFAAYITSLLEKAAYN